MDGIFSRTIKHLLRGCIIKYTHTYISLHIHISRYIYTYSFPWFPGSLLSRKLPGTLQGTRTPGKSREGRIRPSPGRWSSPGAGGLKQGAPGDPCPLHSLGSVTPLLCASVSPLSGAAGNPLARQRGAHPGTVPAAGSAGRAPGQGMAALRAGAVVAVPRGAALHHQQAQSPGEREGRGRGGGEERAPRGPRPRPRPVHREARPPLQVRLRLRQGVLGGEGVPAPWLRGATLRWGGMGGHRGGPIPPSRIPGEHPFWVLDTLQCGCTHLPGVHPSSGAAPVSQGCTQVLECTHLWGLHPTLGAALISRGVPIS